MNSCWESKCHATVQTMLDHRGDKHQASATPCLISRLKTRHSDKAPVSKPSYCQPKLRVGKDLGQEEYPSARRDEAQSEGK